MRRNIFWLCATCLVFLFSCTDTGTQRTPIPPEISILEPDDNNVTPEYLLGDEVAFLANASDNYDSADDLAVVWSTTWLEEGGERTEELGSTTVESDGRSTLITSALQTGVHTVYASVTDSDDLTAEDWVNVDVIAEDLPPTVSITSPLHNTDVPEFEVVNFTAVAGDDHDTSLLSVEWRSSLSGVLDSVPPASNGSVQFVANYMIPGEHDITIEVTDEMDQSATDTIRLNIIAENQPPSTPTVTIDPLGPTTNDDLDCQATGSLDPEGAVVTYTYDWQLGGVSSGWTAITLLAATTQTGEEWSCVVTPWDDQNLDGAPGSATVTIDNTLPSYSSLVLQPYQAYETSILECIPSGWFDPDGDPEGAIYEWWVGGIQSATVTDTLDGADFDHFDDVYCVVYPFDGVDLGNPLTSNTITIENTPPGDPDIAIDPDPLHYDEDILCTIVTAAPDDDNDAIVYEYEWERDGVLEAGLTGGTVPAADTTLGEEWTCRARANDGTDTSSWVEASAIVLPWEGDLVVTEIMVNPEEVDDTAGEYIEIYNTAAEAILLDGFTLSDDGADTHVINSGGLAEVLPGAYLVLGINASNINNGGVSVDYQYANFELDNAPDEVVLSFLTVDVDVVEYDWGMNFPMPGGQSMSLDLAMFNATDNDDGANWCGATTPLFEWGDFGTPGADNDDCDCWYSDLDQDGFGTDPVCGVDYLDCDDNDPTVNPAGFDICLDGIDQDCDGVDRECTCAESDTDGDGYGTAYTCVDVDCDDTDPAVYPGAPELCNLIDDDCDGDTDEGYDNDGDGYATCANDCEDGNPQVNPGANEYCDGIDNDCDGLIDDDGAIGASTWYEDADADGFGNAQVTDIDCYQPTGYVSNDTDCDDNDGDNFPGNPEACDGADNDCDGTADNGLAFLDWYYDADGDLYGDAATGQSTCDGPPGATGWVQTGTDCDDADPQQNPGALEYCNGEDDDCDGDVDEDSAADAQTWYQDADGDSYGNANASDIDCYQPTGYVTDDMDCDDADPQQNPGALEYCNGEDDNCDGFIDEDTAVDAITWYQDYDADGYGNAAIWEVDCYQPSGYVATGTDCDDTESSVNPGATETCNGLDDDCDGTIDEDDAADVVTWYEDADGDGYGNAAVSDIDCDQPAGYVTDSSDCDDTDADNFPGNPEQCDGADNDCDGAIDNGITQQDWFYDADADLYGDSNNSQTDCASPGANWVLADGDCDDAAPAINPGATELCDGVDNDCDGDIDEDDAADAITWYLDSDGDGYGDPNASDVDCDQPVGYVTDNTDCDDSESANYPGASEYCDGVDNNCDGYIDEDSAVDVAVWYRDFDGDGFGDAAAFDLDCDQPVGYLADDTDCDDYDPDIYPGATEYCNGEDDDCDGDIDEDSAADAITWYRDADGDGYGDPGDADIDCDQPAGYLADDSDCDDTEYSVNPSITEVCDGIDNNCDGSTDEAWGDCDLTNVDLHSCDAGSCAVDTCDDPFHDMNLVDSDGCEAEEDIYEVYGGGDYLNYIDEWGPFYDDPATSETIIGNIVPAGDEDWYYVDAVDMGESDGDCDPFNVEFLFTSNPNGEFRFEVYDMTGTLYYYDMPDPPDQDTTCGADLQTFDWDVSTAYNMGECPCQNTTTPDLGYTECSDNSEEFLIRVYRYSGIEDADEYRLTISNG